MPILAGVAMGRSWARFATVTLCAGMSGCAGLQAVRPAVPEYERYTASEHSDFGVVYEQVGDLPAARRQYEMALRKSPTDPVSWTNLGNVSVKEGRWEEAQQAYRQALAFKPGYGPAVNNLASSYLDMSPAHPAMAVALIEAHLALVEPVYRLAIQETLERARQMREEMVIGDW